MRPIRYIPKNDVPRMPRTFEEELRYLQLPFVLGNWQLELAAAEDRGLSFSQTLKELVHKETLDKWNRTTAARIEKARLPEIKSIDSFDWSWPDKINRSRVEQWLSLAFLPSHGCPIVLGPCGVGKTHILIAVVIAACQAGVHSRWTTAMSLVMDLLAHKLKGSYESRLDYYAKIPFLVIDEVGYVSLGQDEGPLLYQLISLRYKKTSTAISSNLPFSQWGGVFGSDPMAAAAVDRLVESKEIMTIEGKSYRLKGIIER